MRTLPVSNIRCTLLGKPINNKAKKEDKQRETNANIKRTHVKNAYSKATNMQSDIVCFFVCFICVFVAMLLL